MIIIDSHTHLHFEHYQKDLTEILHRADNAGIKKMLTIGTDIKSSKQSLELAKQYPNYLLIIELLVALNIILVMLVVYLICTRVHKEKDKDKDKIVSI